MSKIIYSLQIYNSNKLYSKINSILGVQNNKKSHKLNLNWIYELIHDENLPTIKESNIIEHFLNILKNKYHILESINIRREDISIWMIYEYDDQCNLEFNPEILERIGRNGISLCISCYQSGY